MAIKIIALGKLKEDFWQKSQAEYLKRLKRLTKIEIIELPDLPCRDHASWTEEERVREEEAAQIKRFLGNGEYVVALERQGKDVTSLELAQFIQEKEVFSKNIVFVIGGSLGLAKSFCQEVNITYSFSALTFPHQLFRILLLEQLYRAYKINRNEPYHK